MSNINIEKQWYAVYTRSRAEKKALLELEIQGVECYLPLQIKLRQWSDRKKWVEVPLISGYIFVYISLKEYDLVLRTNNVVTYVRFDGKAAIIPDHEIESIKHLLRQNDVALEVSNQVFTKGDKIEIIAGPLMGMKGKLVTLKGKKKVAIEIEQLNLSLMVEIPITEVSKI